jgi:hypothetical protein
VDFRFMWLIIRMPDNFYWNSHMRF